MMGLLQRRMISCRYGFLCMLDIRRMDVPMHVCKKLRAQPICYLLATILAFLQVIPVRTFALLFAGVYLSLHLATPIIIQSTSKPLNPENIAFLSLQHPLTLYPPTKCSFSPIFLVLPSQFWNTLQYGAYDALYNQSQITMKRQNVYIYPIEAKVIFPYHEYRFAISSASYNPEFYDNLVGFVTKLEQGRDHKGVEKIDGYSKYGTLLKIQRIDVVNPHPFFQKNKGTLVSYLGLTFARFKIISLNRDDGRLIASIEIFSDQITKDIQTALEKKNLVQNLKKELRTYYECKLKNFDAELQKERLDSQVSLNKIIYKAISEIELPYPEKIKFLQLIKHEAKVETLIAHLAEKTQNSKGVINIEEKVRKEMSLAQKKKINFFDSSGRMPSEKSELTEKINSKKLPENVKIEIDKEMKNMGSGSSKSVSQKYIETLLEIPWLESTEDVKDIAVAEKILQEDHTGLKEVKERILEFLSVKFRNGNSKGNIICLHGPPGVGKTSIAKSIARALGRSFTRVSLGGMNDQAELRGHRRTYVAALPGVIIRALIKAKSNNPVILLDEIQKIGKSYKGDPEHALLEILDPSQNTSFVDHYVSIPVDLSKVMFICTANSLELSTPLLNRLELIEVPGYSRQEKLQIAQNHLIPLQIKENGVDGIIDFEKEGIKQVIEYSSQLGVRQLERKISKICRKVARKGVKTTITKQKVEEYLGKKHKNERWNGVGVVNGMAWTQMGGKLLTVEAILYRSEKQKIDVTGQLGDVMKESVNIAFSWIKSNFQELAIVDNLSQHLTSIEKTKYLDEVSLHLHFPEGATKKDGPSAGVTIVTCLSSLLMKIPPRENLSMTGEITLSGKVLPVGGIRQKCIAAIYQGIQHIIIPFGNLKDLQKIDEQLRKRAQFYPVKEIKEVLQVAFPGIAEKNTPKL